MSNHLFVTYDTKVKDRQHHLLDIAHSTLALIEQEDDAQCLRALADLTLTLKPLLDELPAYPDLGLELHEYAVLKSEDSGVANKFRTSIKAMLGD